MTDLILLSDEVKSALSKGTPVVALESTIISHGMPYPENVKTARKLEDIIRAEGSVPTIVATEKGVLKVSRRVSPPLLLQEQ
jgi:pseudouridine-5'-phosphate glycosidase